MAVEHLQGWCDMSDPSAGDPIGRPGEVGSDPLSDLHVNESDVLAVIGTLINASSFLQDFMATDSSMLELQAPNDLANVLKFFNVDLSYERIPNASDLVISSLKLSAVASNFLMTLRDIFGTDVQGALTILALKYRPDKDQDWFSVGLQILASITAVLTVVLTDGAGEPIAALLWAAVGTQGISTVYDWDHDYISGGDAALTFGINLFAGLLGIPGIQAWMDASPAISANLQAALDIVFDSKKGIPAISIILGDHYDGNIEGALKMLLAVNNPEGITDAQRQALLDLQALAHEIAVETGQNENTILKNLINSSQKIGELDTVLQQLQTPIAVTDPLAIPTSDSANAWLAARQSDYKKYGTDGESFAQFIARVTADRGYSSYPKEITDAYKTAKDPGGTLYSSYFNGGFEAFLNHWNYAHN